MKFDNENGHMVLIHVWDQLTVTFNFSENLSSIFLLLRQELQVSLYLSGCLSILPKISHRSGSDFRADSKLTSYDGLQTVF